MRKLEVGVTLWRHGLRTFHESCESTKIVKEDKKDICMAINGQTQWGSAKTTSNLIAIRLNNPLEYLYISTMKFWA